MKYKIYQKMLEKDDFFKTWDNNQFDSLTAELKDRIYEKYKLKCDVLQRDKFRCQNDGCKFDSELTVHHIKAKRNGGKDTVRNCVTLCLTCHKGFERGKRDLVFSKNASHLPPHIQGHTFRLSAEEKRQIKQLKFEMKALRKTLKTQKYNTSWDDVAKLMRWLFKYLDDY